MRQCAALQGMVCGDTRLAKILIEEQSMQFSILYPTVMHLSLNQL